MSKEIKKYKPMLEVILKDGTSLFVDAQYKELLFNEIQEKSHVIINGQLYDKFKIEKVVNSKPCHNPLVGEDENISKAVKIRIEDYCNNTGRLPSDHIILNWIVKLKNNRKLFE